MTTKLVSRAFFKCQCNTCKCEFTYEFNDTVPYTSDGVSQYKVICPNCKAGNRHDVKRLVNHMEYIK